MNFFSRVVHRLSFLLKPLTQQLRAKTFVLTDTLKMSLSKLRDCLKRGIGVSHRCNDDESRPIFVAVDSSLTACGFVVGNCNLRDNQPIDISYAHFGSSNFDLVFQSMGSRNRELIGLSRAL